MQVLHKLHYLNITLQLIYLNTNMVIIFFFWENLCVLENYVLKQNFPKFIF